jgi:nitrogen fixation NifU-like protein
MQIKLKKEIVKEIGFTGKGCAISIASASLLSEYAKGRDVKELSSLKSEFVIGLLHIELTPNRLKCALLPWEALRKLITI